MMMRMIVTALLVCAASSAFRASADELRRSREDTAIHVPTPPDVVDEMLRVAKLSSKDVLYDLGCGDGRIVIAAARKFGCHAAGYDIDARKVKQSQANVKQAGLESLVKVEQKDVFKLDLSPASVVTLYLLPEMHEQLIPQLQELKKGSRIVTHDFPIEGMRHDLKRTLISKSDDTPHYIFLYKTPLTPNQSPR